MNGDFSKTPFPKVLWELFSSKATGILEIKKAQIEKKITFELGQPIYAESNLLHETLGRVLVEDQVLTSDQEQAALVKSVEASKPFGTALIELKFVDPAKLYETLKKTLALKLLDCFTWDKGTYTFTVDPTAPEKVQGFKMNAGRLILKGIDSTYPETLMSHYHFPFQSTFRTVSKSLSNEEVQLTGEEIKILKDFQAGKKIEKNLLHKLYAFWLLGFVEVSEGEREVSLDELVGAALLQGLKPVEEKTVPISQEDPETQKMANEIASDHMKLMQLNFFELLNAPETATAVEIRNKFIEFSGRYNPARFKGPKLGEFKDRGEEIFLRGVKAFNMLSDFDLKTKYIDKLKLERKDSGEGGKKKIAGESFKIQTKLLDAAPQFEEGLRLMKAKKYLQAIEFFQYASDIDSRNASYLAHIGWCTYNHAPDRNLKPAEEILKRAMEIGSNPYPFYFYGKLLQLTERSAEAIPLFKKALEFDSKNVEILRDLRSLEKK